MNYENSHRKNVDLYARQIDQIYQSAVSEATAIGQSVTNLNGDKLFSFADYPITHDRIDKLINKLKNSVETVILNGIDSEWTLSNNKNNELCNRVFGDNVGKLSKEQYRRYYSTNGKAQDAFKARKVSGLGLSDRVWSYTKQFKTEIELGLDLGIGSGLSATEITRDLKEYLKYPDKLFRRVRDKHGVLQLSKAAKAFNPGQGVYRSSYKNALRLTRTETNIAYRTADHERWQQFDFVVGIEIKKSANHPIADMCDNLAGKYPKDFKFTGWHPQCRCYVVSILKTSDEMERDTQRILSGEPIDGRSVNYVNDTPLNFKDWIEDNQERIDKAKQLPYFLRDNRSFWEEKKNSESLFNGDIPFTMNSDIATLLRSKGFILSDEIIKSYDTGSMSGFNMVEFDYEFSKILETHKLEITGKSIVMYEGKTKFEYVYKFEDKSYFLERTFRIQDGVKCVHHDYFNLPPSLQGVGISKKTFKSLYKQYQNADISIIDVQANINVGGYTWAKYGFSANKQAALDIIKNSYLTSDLKTESLEFVSQYNSVDGKFPMRLLADKPYGKDLLLRTSWNGVIDLRDVAQCDIFEKYLLQ